MLVRSEQKAILASGCIESRLDVHPVSDLLRRVSFALTMSWNDPPNEILIVFKLVKEG